MKFPTVLKTLGFLILGLAASLAIPLAWSLHFRSPDLIPILATMFVAAACGALLLAVNRRADPEIGRKEGMAVVTLGWLAASLIGALPYRFGGVCDNLNDAFFESMSGFTTTGATILQDITVVPPGLLVWRALTQWLGGMGIIVLFIAVLPYLGVGGRQLFRSEVPGPVPEGLKPRVQQTARALWVIYLALTLLETMFLMIGGMSLYEALCHSFTTLATGGFSTRNASVGEFQSPFIEWVIIVFMVFAGVNFALYYHLLKSGPARVFKDPEFKLYILIVLIATGVIAVYLYVHKVEPSFSSGVRASAFQSVSMLTTTGYGTEDFNAWPSFTKALLVLLMFIGGCSGSTGGSMKVGRVLIVGKWLFNEVRRVFRPRQIRLLKLGDQLIPDSVRDAILAFTLLYFGVFAGGTLFITFLGSDLITGFSAVIACLGNVGPGLGGVGPMTTYAAIPAAGKLFLSLAMLLGRLELYTVLVFFSSSFWKR